MIHAVHALDAMKGLRVLVVGDVMLDRFLWGRATRLSPEAPVPVVEVVRETLAAGGAANVANNVAALGGHVTLIGMVGNDEAATHLEAELLARGVQDLRLLAVSHRPTTQKTRILATNQQLVRVDREDASPISVEDQERLITLVESAIQDCDVMVLSDYRKGVLLGTLPSDLIRLATKRGVMTIADSKATDLEPFSGSILTPNLVEAEKASGYPIRNSEELEVAGRTLLRSLHGAAPLLITLGAQGMALFCPDEPTYRVPAVNASVFDVTGAGDTVVGALALALGAGMVIHQAVELANLAAGVVVREVGTAVCTPEKLRLIMRERNDPTTVAGAW